MRANVVRFSPGARTAWHHHAVGQSLRIVAGIALIGPRDSTVFEAHPGTLLPLIALAIRGTSRQPRIVARHTTPTHEPAAAALAHGAPGSRAGQSAPPGPSWC